MINSYSIIAYINNELDYMMINKIRYDIFKKFHGESATTLPLHITIIKWKSYKGVDTAIKIFNKCNLLYLNTKKEIFSNKIEFNIDFMAVWLALSMCYHIDKIANCIKEYALTLDSFNIVTYKTPHITIAYNDYSKNELNRIYKYIKQETKERERFNFKLENIYLCKHINEKWKVVYTSE